MPTQHSLKTLLYKTIHRNAKSAEQLADEIGISYSYLCCAGLPLDESGVKFPLENIIPLMKAAGDYSVLKHINQLCGFLMVRAPRGFRSKIDEVLAVNEYNALCSAASKLLMEFFHEPSPAKLEDTNAALQAVMECSASLQKRIKDFNQMEMEL
jgi:hypothetical protein